MKNNEKHFPLYRYLKRDPGGAVHDGIQDPAGAQCQGGQITGASLFLYTDGLSETIDPDEQMFGTERILEQLNKEPDASPEETLHSMKEAVVAYIKGKEPFDDMTMMSFVYYGAVE